MWPLWSVVNVQSVVDHWKVSRYLEIKVNFITKRFELGLKKVRIFLFTSFGSIFQRVRFSY
jgi:hypothetical protein